MPTEKILVVDDSFEMREFVADSVLRLSGYETLKADNGQAGLELARQASPNLIIADMRMPKLTGLELAQIIQREKLNIPIILITAEGSEQLAREALRAGVADYFVKPFKTDDLLLSVRRVLDTAQARDESSRVPNETVAINESLRLRLKELETLIGVGHNVTSVLDVDQVLSKAVEAAVSLTGAEEGSLLLLEEETNELTMRAAKNFDDNFVRTFRLRSDDSLAGQVIRTGEPVLLDENAPQKIKTSYLVHSLVYVPLKIHGRVIGVLGVDNRRAGRAFTQHHQRLLGAVGDYAAIAIENARAYRRTEKQRLQLETILHETEDGVIVVDTDKRLILINPTARAAFGVNGAPVVGRAIAEVVSHPDIRDLFNEDGRRREITLADGRIFNAHLTPINGIGQAVVMQDITHLKELDRIKSEFVTTVSHDLRSPLTAILGYVELLGRAGPVTPQQADFMRRIQVSVQSITALITDLLDLGRIEAGFDIQKEVTYPALVVRYAVDSVRQQAEAKGQNLVISVPESLPRLCATPARLRQMFGNLLENAIKYTPEGGTITVTGRAEQDFILLTISDTGLGIPPADQPYIFDKFFRAGNTRMDYVGTGLGLSIVKSIVEDHAGRIWVESKLNQGTTFTVMLPEYKEETA